MLPPHIIANDITPYKMEVKIEKRIQNMQETLCKTILSRCKETQHLTNWQGSLMGQAELTDFYTVMNLY